MKNGMELKLIELETAVLSKEVGFDCCTEYFYTDHKNPHLDRGLEYMSDCYIRSWKWNSMPGNYPTKEEDVICSAPEQALLQQWLREVHEIHTSVYRLNGKWCNQLFNLENDTYISKYKLFDTYEEALEDGLFQGLKMIKDD